MKSYKYAIWQNGIEIETNDLINDTLLNNSFIENILKENFKKIKYQYVWHAAEAVFNRKFIPLNVYIRKEVRSQVNDPSFKLKKQGKELNSKQTAGKETNLRSEINEIENREII